MELGFGFGEWREGARGGRVLGFWGLLFLWNGLGPIISCANNALGGKFWGNLGKNKIKCAIMHSVFFDVG